MAEIAFTVHAAPVAQPRTSTAKSGHRYTPDNGIHLYKAAITRAYREQRDTAPHDGPVAMTVTFIMPRPRSIRWKKRPMPRCWHTKRPDADNMLKAVKDALNGIAYTDDSRVCKVEVTKRYASGDEGPRTEITITELEEA